MVMMATALSGREESVFALRGFWEVNENENEWVRGGGGRGYNRA